MHRSRPPTLALVGALALAGCGSQAADDDSGAAITAVATTTHVADIVGQVGGDRVAVERLLDPATDPHDYEARPSDAEAIAEAAVVFRSGGELDGWLDDLLESANGGAPVIDLAEASGASPSEDPHWWQDPRNAIVATDRIAHELAAADPAGAETYRRNAHDYIRRIERLDAAIARCLAAVPRQQRKLVTTHDSYGHFADRYGIEVVGALIPSRSTEAQPSAGATAELVERIESAGVSVIFPESALDPELERAVADESGASVGEPLWGDSLGPEGSAGATYLEALASDAEAMASGFTGGTHSCALEP